MERCCLRLLRALPLLMLAVSGASARIFDKCELVNELRRLGVAERDLNDWVCLAYHESRYDTSAAGRLNADNSVDHGLFQISDIYWCDWSSREPHRRYKNVCRANCDAFRDDDIRDDLACVMKIHKEHEGLQGNGFMAWAAWKSRCQGTDMSSYTAGCARGPATRPPSTRPTTTATTGTTSHQNTIDKYYQDPKKTNAHTHFNNLAPLINRLQRIAAPNKGRLVPYTRGQAFGGVHRAHDPLLRGQGGRTARRGWSETSKSQNANSGQWQSNPVPTQRQNDIPQWRKASSQSQNWGSTGLNSYSSSNTATGNYGSNIFLKGAQKASQSTSNRAPGKYEHNVFLKGASNAPASGTGSQRFPGNPFLSGQISGTSASHPYTGNVFLSGGGGSTSRVIAPKPTYQSAATDRPTYSYTTTTRTPFTTRRTTRRPFTTRKPFNRQPLTTRKPRSTRKPATTRKPFNAGINKGFAFSAPTSTRKLYTTRRPVTTRRPLTTRRPNTTRRPFTTRRPNTTRKAYTTRRPNTTRRSPSGTYAFGSKPRATAWRSQTSPHAHRPLSPQKVHAWSTPATTHKPSIFGPGVWARV